MLKTVLLEEMTSPQIKAAIEADYDTVLVAGGAIEQHGKHLPIGMDTMGGYESAVLIAREIGKTLVAPVIRPGCSDHHLSFAGSLSVSKDLFQELCRAYCQCLCHHGFRNIVLLPSHGGNIEAMEEIVPVLDAELSCRVVWANVLRDPRGAEALAAILAKYGVTREEGGVHSGFVETSMLLATTYGKWVDMAVAERGFVGDHNARIAEVSHPDGHWNLADISPVGVLGDPTKATAEAGLEILGALISVEAQVVRDALGWN